MKTKSILLSLLCFVFAVQAYPQWSNKSFTFESKVRQYRVYIPSIYNSANPAGVVVTLHGLGDNMTNFSQIGMNHIADTANFIVLVPQALTDALLGSSAWNSGAGMLGYYPNASINDMGFINAMIDTTAAHYSVNPLRVYCCGFSMGGFMTERMAVQSNAKFAAFASVSGTIGSGVNPVHPGRALPVMHCHGTNDSTVYYHGDLYGIDPDSLVHYWIHNNQCDTSALHVNIPNTVNDGDTVETFDYLNGLQNSEVLFYKVHGGVHTWCYTPAYDIDYSTEIWKFFRKHTNLAYGINVPQNIEYDIHVYPNPATDFINIELPQSLSGRKLTLQLYNMQGALSMTEQITGTNAVIPLTGKNLGNGVYLLRVFDNKSQFTQRVMVER